MGHFVETAVKPQWNTVEEYETHIKKEVPITVDRSDMLRPDIECMCCGQGAPHVAAALVKVKDHTPITMRFPGMDGTPNGQQGSEVWICANCYNFGVRPKYTKFGDVYWNNDGKRIKARAEKHDKPPW